MTRQAQELAWDISDWAEDADLTETNIEWNMRETFFKNGLTLPSSIVVRPDQRRELIEQYKHLAPDMSGLDGINLGFGTMRLKVVQPGYSKDVRL